MKIDNSRAKTWWECPLKFVERYENNLEPRVRSNDALVFGTRMHQLLECRYNNGATSYPALEDAGLEAEAQLTFEAYCAYYIEEPFEVVGVEKYFEVPLRESVCGLCRNGFWKQGEITCLNCGGTGTIIDHTYIGEFDAIVRMKDSGRLCLFETKTESRSSKSNTHESWASKSQVGLYLWAAEKVYGEKFEGIILNVITRQSPKGQCAPLFRRDSLVRTDAQKKQAVENITWVADSIERMRKEFDSKLAWPQNRNNCVSQNGWKCDYFALHVEPEGRPSEELVNIKFKPAEEYLSGL